jgi:hypothetical protein
MARWSAFLITAMVIALVVSNVAFADQKKPVKTTTTSSGSIKGDTTDQGHEKWIFQSSPRGSTGSTVLPKPTQGSIHR